MWSEIRPTAPPPRQSRVVAHRGPQTVAVQDLGVVLHRLARAGGDYRPALVVNVEHELLRLRLGVPEYGLEYIGHIGHEVDRVVPHDGDPWRVGRRVLPG